MTIKEELEATLQRLIEMADLARKILEHREAAPGEGWQRAFRYVTEISQQSKDSYFNLTPFWGKETELASVDDAARFIQGTR